MNPNTSSHPDHPASSSAPVELHLTRTSIHSLSTEAARSEGSSSELHRTERLSPEARRAESSSSEASKAEARRPESRNDNRCVTATATNHRDGSIFRPAPPEHSRRTDWLRDVAKDPDVALSCMASLGADVGDLDVPFPCLLHEDCLARLTRGGNQEIVYKDGHQAETRRQFQTFPELRAALSYGKPRRLGGLELTTWRLRLLHDAGLLALPPVRMPSIPPSSPDFVGTVFEGFELLVRCREWLEPGAAVTFARSFGAAWCRLDQVRFRDALDYLVHRQVIVKVGEAPSQYARPVNLYRPGVA